jgi:diadenylate cyclase
MILPDFNLAIRWQDVVDILLNSYILFRLHILFRGTNTFRVLIGIAFLWFFQRIALTMGLIVTSWAFQGITAAAALIIIVVFRNEIRTVFHAQNWQALLWGLPKHTVQSESDLLSSTFFALADKRIGAILVFPGKEDLSELIYGGILWNGDVSAEMITSVFWPGNPAHDGAAVIAGKKITTVGSILPLTNRMDLPTSWGTRHRAAAGLAERSDALVVIVSEERGDVLAAKGTAITKIKTPQKMKTILQAHTDIKKTTETGIRSEAFKLAMVAALSLVLVTSAWISFSRGRDTLISLDVPVHYLNLGSDFEIVDSSANTVKLHLSGFSTLINALRPDQIAVKLDLGRVTNGSNTFQIGDKDVSLPPGITLTGMSPSRVDVVLDAKATRTLPVQVDWVGSLPRGIIVSGVHLEPATLSITARRGLIGELKTIYTEKVPLDTITGSGQVKVKPVLEDSIRLAENEKEVVVIHYEVKKRD